jgi:DNA-directed RNA polymerase specialized sigma24 family protein
MSGDTVADVVRPLTADQRARLERARQAQARASERYAEVLRSLVAEGAPVASIAAALGISRQALNKQLQRRGLRAGSETDPDEPR